MSHRRGALLADGYEGVRPAAGTAAAMGVGVLSLLLAAVDLHLPGRPALAVLTVLVVPGVPIVANLPVGDRLVQLVLAVAISLAALLLVSTVQLESGLWSPLGTQMILLAVGAVASVATVRGASR